MGAKTTKKRKKVGALIPQPSGKKSSPWKVAFPGSITASRQSGNFFPLFYLPRSLAILASVREIAASKALTSSGVEGRPPRSRRMRSNSCSVINGPRNRPVGSMGEEIREDNFGVLLKVADGISKGLLVGQIMAGELSAQALIEPENVPVGKAVRGIISGNVYPVSLMDRQEHHSK